MSKKDSISEMNRKTKKSVFRIEFSDDLIEGCSRTVGSIDDKGRMLLAEINLAELPKNRVFPTNGYLRFFIDGEADISENEELFGRGNCKVEIADEPYDESDSFAVDYPIISPARLLFTEDKESISSCDEAIFRYMSDDAVSRHYRELNGGQGSKLLGWPFFTQQDPDRYPKYDTLLFQLDSKKNLVNWGDMGVGNFFINGKALKKGDFSDVLFNWDCF